VKALRARVAAAQRWLVAIYRLELDLAAERFLVSPERARRLLPARSPRSGLLVLEEAGELHLGLYVDPRDAADAATIVEETSHLLCVAWHATVGRPVSPLLLELQGEVDRYAVARLAGGDALGHFHDFRWEAWMGAGERRRYHTAHSVARRYCRGLENRFPRRADTPALLAELRRFYRADRAEKLRAAA
jgi:hypothetical protein